MRALAGVLVAIAILGAPIAAAQQDEEIEARGPSLGLVLDGGEVPAALAARDPRYPIDVRLAADWSSVETSAGTYDWSTVAAPIDALAGRGVRITLCVRGETTLHPRESGPEAVPDGAWMQAWTALLRSAVATFGGKLFAVEIGERPDRAFDPAAYAFVLKSSALAVKAEGKAHGAEVRVAQGAVGSDAAAWEKSLLDNDAAPYIESLPVLLDAGGDAASAVAPFVALVVEHPPAVALAVYVAPREGAPWSAFDDAVRALAASVGTALVVLPPPSPESDHLVTAATALQAMLAPGYTPAPPGRLGLRAPEGGESPGAAILGRFLHTKDLATTVVYEAPLTGAPEAQARLLLDTIDVKDPRVVDLVTGGTLKTGPAAVPNEKAKALRIVLADHPMVVAWDRAAAGETGIEAAPTDVRVAGTRGLTAAEIIAHHQQVQKVQDDKLDRWMAKGHIDFHFKFAQGGSSLDVSIESNYFWHRGGDLEWEQTKYYVNGNLVTWKKIPELPLIQPEKVVTLPLDLTLDKTYDYKLAGEDTAQGRAAYVLAFEPASGKTGKSLYRGRVWIDKETFVRLKVSVVQTNLEPPVVSNDESDDYLPITAPDGFVYRMLAKADGQQLWTAGGRNFVVRREVRFDGFQINPSQDDFDAAVKAAYASEHQMLRDTNEGFRYLEKDQTGGRAVKATMDTSQLFLAGGAFKDNAINGVVPLAGVNWFDYDFLKKNVQFNIFFAGVYTFANLTDPAIGKSKFDLGAEASLVALKLDEKYYVAGVEDVKQRVRRRSQYLTGRLGHPLGTFVKLTAIADIAWNQYTDSSDADDALAASNLAFVLPSNHELYTGTFQVEFNKKGYSITGRGSYSHRSDWQPWGLYDPATQQFVGSTFDPGQANFTTWGATAFKEWYLPHFQKIRGEVDYLGGNNLDRFSEYQFDFFGDTKLDGYSGTGVRFDEGYIGRLAWAFNLFNVIRFDLSLESAHVRDGVLDEPFRNHTGMGLSFNVVGPWMTIWQASYGRAMWSDIPELEGKQEFLLVILKLFK
ncbi:MAG TPA: hypothetical protein VFV19_03545 [Candidatus Polarisedimenticolaceae bacterium]|nr:hypothetical protein [Candidatus Polarisedimenticolaceae bacterium]